MAKRVLYLIVCAAPPARAISEFIELAQEKDWTVCPIATPHATAWIDTVTVKIQTGFSVRDRYRRPDDQEPLPRADAIVVAPATFNTVNKWVAGISDTFALGILCEAIGLRLPIVVAPYAKSNLAAHPAYARSLQALDEWGVTVLPNEVIRVGTSRDIFDWQPLVAALGDV